MTAAKTPTFTVRHVLLFRALFAAVAAVMITFSGEHSATVGLAVFSGFAVATGLVWALSAWLVYPAGRRIGPILLAIVSLAAGIISGAPSLRTTVMFFVIVLTWAVLSAVIEGVWALRERRGTFAAEAKDGLSVAVITLVFAVGTVVVSPNYALEYFNKKLGEGGTLTGITIAVGLYGAYAAIIAVFLAIAGLSPKKEAVGTTPAAQEVVS